VPEDLAARVIAVIAKTQRLDPANITLESTFAELKIDSLDGINLLFALEGEFNISIPDEEAKRLTSVREAVDGVSKLMSASDAAAVPAHEAE
jgi:acyl carrier protein